MRLAMDKKIILWVLFIVFSLLALGYAVVGAGNPKVPSFAPSVQVTKITYSSNGGGGGFVSCPTGSVLIAWWTNDTVYNTKVERTSYDPSKLECTTGVGTNIYCFGYCQKIQCVSGC